MNSVLFVVHGIRDNGAWANKIGALYVGDAKDRAAESYKFGFFDILKFLFWPTRRSQVRLFRNRLTSHLDLLREQGVSPRVHFAAHSFGTHLVTRALQTLPADYPIDLGNVVLMSSVLPSTMNILGLAKGFPGYKVTNFCSVDDNVLLVNAALPLNSGLAGRVGFHAVFEGSLLQQRYFRFGHGGYFADIDAGPRSWVARYCLPALNDEQVPEGTHQRPKRGDFFASFLRFSKLLTTATAAAIVVAIVAVLTGPGVLRTYQDAAARVEKSRSLSVVNMPSVEAIEPPFPYSLFPGFWPIASRADKLFARLVAENEVAHVLTGVPGGVSRIAERDSDGALLAAVADKTLLLTVDPGAKNITYRANVVRVGSAIGAGFDSEGHPWIQDGPKLLVGDCNDCVEPKWRSFDAGALSIDGVIDFGDDRYLARDADNKLYYADPAGALRPAIPTTPEQFRPNVEQGLPQDGGLWAMPMEDAFSDYVVLGSAATLAIVNVVSGEGLLLSHNPDDIRIASGNSIDENQALADRSSQVLTGRPTESIFGDPIQDGQYCAAAGECVQWPMAFTPGKSSLSVDWVGADLIVEDAREDASRCLHVASVERHGTISVLAPVAQAAQSVACPGEAADPSASGDTLALPTVPRPLMDIPVVDMLPISPDGEVMLFDNRAAYLGHDHDTGPTAARVATTGCVETADGSVLSGLSFVPWDDQLLMVCGDGAALYDEWGQVGYWTIGHERYSDDSVVLPLVQGNRIVGMAVPGSGRLLLYDDIGSLAETDAVPNGEPFAGESRIGDEAYFFWRDECGGLAWTSVAATAFAPHAGAVVHSDAEAVTGVDMIERIDACRDGSVKVSGQSYIDNSTLAPAAVRLSSAGKRLPDDTPPCSAGQWLPSHLLSFPDDLGDGQGDQLGRYRVEWGNLSGDWVSILVGPPSTLPPRVQAEALLDKIQQRWPG